MKTGGLNKNGGLARGRIYKTIGPYMHLLYPSINWEVAVTNVHVHAIRLLGKRS